MYNELNNWEKERNTKVNAFALKMNEWEEYLQFTKDIKFKALLFTMFRGIYRLWSLLGQN